MENALDRKAILDGDTVLGIEFGSTRIKSVLIDRGHRVLAVGSHEWENHLEDGIWTYHVEEIWGGLQDSYRDLAAQVKKRYDAELTRIGAIGVSAMMHGYMPFDKDGTLLVPFRTWRNTITREAAQLLTEKFAFNIPQRWTIAHLYQAILNGEPHVRQIDFLCPLEVYVHWKLTGEKKVGVGEGSGIFPLDPATLDYDRTMLDTFEKLVEKEHFAWRLSDIFPKIVRAGEPAGYLTPEGAKLLDVSGRLQPGIPFCPPEGDADTGLVSTNSIAKKTGSVSAGTSIFAMVVLEKELTHIFPEVDLFRTPTGALTAMVHCNNATSDFNAWVRLLSEFSALIGEPISPDGLYERLCRKALESENDCSGLLCYNFVSSEPIAGISRGVPLLVRRPDEGLSLADFMKAQLWGMLGTLRIGMDLLLERESVAIDSMTAQGGLFKTRGVMQNYLASAVKTPILVPETAGEGGAWGMALLAAYMKYRKEGQSLEEYLDREVFASMKSETVQPDPACAEEFDRYLAAYRKGLEIARTAETVGIGG